MKNLGRLLGTTLIAASAILSQACSGDNKSIMGPQDADSVAGAQNALELRQPAEEPRERDEVTLPAAPDQLFVSVNDTTRVSIAFRDNADNEDGFWIHYVRIDTVQNSPTFGYGTPEQMHLDAFDNEANLTDWATADITGLESGSVYKVWVVAYNSAGESAHCMNHGGTVPAEELLPPAAPDQLFVSLNDTTVVSIAFRDNADNEDGFWLYYSRIDTVMSSDTYGYGPREQMHLDAFDNESELGDIATAEIRGLLPGSVYRVWVVAFNEAGESGSCSNHGGTKPKDDREELIVGRDLPEYRAEAAF